MSIFGDLRESTKGLVSSSDDLAFIREPTFERMSLAQNVTFEPVFNTNLLKAPKPKDIDFKNRKSSHFIDQYIRASYYFNHCSVLATVILRIVQEATRNGIEWKPLFQCKCPKCGYKYTRSTKTCTQCGFEGEMLLPDESQKGLLINWEGTPLLKKANKAGWDLLEVVRSFLIITLVYNQPVFLCQSIYAVDEHGSAVDEFPQQITPLDPAKSRMIYDDSGEPGDSTAFTLLDRFKATRMDDTYWKMMMDTGYGPDNLRYYPARWQISSTHGGSDAGTGEYYADEEIYHDTYLLPSVNYGLPLCLLVESDVRAWIALEMRVEKYYSTGHPQGVFVVNNITNDASARLQQTIRMQMREDPYTIPVLGIPPSSDKATSTKWHPFAVDPAESMIAVKQELLQRISAIFGMSGLFLGDTEAMRGNGNESHQVALLDRNLVPIRKFADRFLEWIQHKYKCPGGWDWELRIVEPPDNQTLDEAKKFNQELLNAKLAMDLGFEIISQADGKIEISATPRSYDPIASLFGKGNNSGQSPTVETDFYRAGLSKDGSAMDAFGGEDLLKETTTNKGNTDERIELLINLIRDGRVRLDELYIRQ